MFALHESTNRLQTDTNNCCTRIDRVQVSSNWFNKTVCAHFYRDVRNNITNMNNELIDIYNVTNKQYFNLLITAVSRVIRMHRV